MRNHKMNFEGVEPTTLGLKNEFSVHPLSRLRHQTDSAGKLENAGQETMQYQCNNNNKINKLHPCFCSIVSI